MRFHVGSDHGAVALRKTLVAALRDWGIPVLGEYGPEAPSTSVDYPDVAVEVCKRMLDDRRESDDVFGLLLCGSGQGMAMTANKLPGVRAGCVADAYSARMIRAHNDANVICMGERVLGSELAKLLLREFIDSPFEGGRHEKRVALIESAARGRGGESAGEGS
jgi:ribose 5-phosphate isomerase B